MGKDGRGALQAVISATPKKEADNDDKRRSVSPRVGRWIPSAPMGDQNGIARSFRRAAHLRYEKRPSTAESPRAANPEKRNKALPHHAPAEITSSVDTELVRRTDLNTTDKMCEPTHVCDLV